MTSSRTALNPLLFLMLIGVPALGCRAEPNAEPTIESDDADLIGGKWVNDPGLDAVGRIFIGGIGGCVGTLVSPRIVISGRHCRVLASRSGLDRDDVVFEVAKTERVTSSVVERKRFRVVAELTTGRAGIGMLGIGRDVAVMMLSEPVPAALATPIPVRARPLDASDIGKKLTGVAYDTINTWGKMKGPSTLDAVSGKPYQKAYPSLEAAQADAQAEIHSQTSAQRRPQGPSLQFDQNDFEAALDEEAYEVHVGLTTRGRATSDVQFCHGDSGGPLLEGKSGHYQLVAVVTGGEDECVLGGVATSVGLDYQHALGASVEPTPWAWACDPKKSESTAKVSTCTEERRTSCSGFYYNASNWFTDINVEACAAE
jgi:hypothetical protein